MKIRIDDDEQKISQDCVCSDSLDRRHKESCKKVTAHIDDSPTVPAPIIPMRVVMVIAVVRRLMVLS